jgi:hypothetical protein
VITLAAMTSAERKLAKECYGYGSWEAPYWFIGPEQGQAAWEDHDLNLRHRAFCQLEEDGLCDCACFHRLIGETRWHRATKPALQRTWSRLILLLMSFLQKPGDKKPLDNEAVRAYQRDHWGKHGDETCVIELSGLPARNLNVLRERDAFREERIRFIRQKMLACKPVSVVMYGHEAKEDYQKIAEMEFYPDDSGSVRKVESTIFAFAKHPVSWGLRNKYWVELGRKM